MTFRSWRLPVHRCTDSGYRLLIAPSGINFRALGYTKGSWLFWWTRRSTSNTLDKSYTQVHIPPLLFTCFPDLSFFNRKMGVIRLLLRVIVSNMSSSVPGKYSRLIKSGSTTHWPFRSDYFLACSLYSGSNLLFINPLNSLTKYQIWPYYNLVY